MSKPLRMHQIRRIIEMQLEGRSIRYTTRLSGLSRNTVRESLAAIVYVPADEKATAGRSVDARYDTLQDLLPGYIVELRKRGVTRQLLWQEYRNSTASYNEKQRLQFLLFPEGILYNRTEDKCRTTDVNEVFSYIAELERLLQESKSRTSHKNFESAA